MKICLVSVEIFAWGKYGGFGRSTRMIGRELARRGVEVTAVVPRRMDQRPVELLDGIRVLGFDLSRPLSALDLYHEADADIYHSQEPSFGTHLAQRAKPGRGHVVTFRDTRSLRDWWIEFLHPSLNRAQVLGNLLYEDNFLVHEAVRRADRWFAAAQLIIPKARRKYRLPSDPHFLPSPIPFADDVQKSPEPQVCFIARLDRRKRPQVFLDLARRFPEVRFLVLGAGRDPSHEQALREKYGRLPNLEFAGFMDQFSGGGLQQVLGRSWVLVNTSAREGLPTSFIEAAGHGCAILSSIDPDGFASRFGLHVPDGDFSAGLRFLLQDDRWRGRGQAGMEFAREHFSLEHAMDLHLKEYRDLSAA